MRQKLTRWKKVGLVFSMGLVLATSILLPLYTGTAHAAGEQWIFHDDTSTITATGGVIIGTANITNVGWSDCTKIPNNVWCFRSQIGFVGSASRDSLPSGYLSDPARANALAPCIYDIFVSITRSELNDSIHVQYVGQPSIHVEEQMTLLNPRDDQSGGVIAGSCKSAGLLSGGTLGIFLSPSDIPVMTPGDAAAQQQCAAQGGQYDLTANPKKCVLPSCPAVQNVQGIYDTSQKKCAYPASSFPDGKCPAPLVTQGTTCVGDAGAIPSSTDTTNGEEPDVCPVEKTTPLRWFACPIVSAGEVITNVLDATINYFLTIDTTNMFGTATGGSATNIGDPSGGNSAGFYKAWSTFRNIGIALVVISGLIMVMSEMLGLGIVDAYTIRKTLPRLVVAIIGISVSWFLSFYLITFFNKLGHGISSLIYSAFSGLPQGGTGSGGAQTISIFAQYFAVGAGLAALGVLGILSFLGTIILALLVGIAVLILREAIVIMCVIMGPLAIAAYTLPNTAKFAKFWWDTFIKALMAFPIITGFIAICKVMAVITGQIGTN